ncbi:hypothetical protein CDO73_17540 [Saccharibacillus sp. O23]|uniref:response regulator n=1 Tax=Saccharibacillus sp. O23 TaxID=2009338 RepID=UPI000B4E3ED3|nr:response regulator [Saccharibacillus sp. O23]OWR28701.1 hypothetical protein CDO73_17540 [Saccharibacillus sp. O23]
MYHAIIAEDSKPILRNIRMLIEASGLPVQVTATASNGQEALERLETQHADILLTDIRMPKLDGLGLIEQAKLLNPRLQTVLISGYSDFEYARRAVNLQAFDYLLKPVEQAQLTDVLTRLLKQLREQERSDRRLLEGVVAPEVLAAMPLDAGLLAGERISLLIRRQPFAPEPQGGREWTADAVADALRARSWAAGLRVLPTPQAGQWLALPEARADLSAEELADEARQALADGGLPAAVLAAPQPAELRALAGIYGKLDRAMRDRLTVDGRLASPGAGEAESGASPQGGEAAKLALQAQLAELIAQRQKERFLLLLRRSLPHWLAGSARYAGLERFVRWLADELAPQSFAPAAGGGHAAAGESARQASADQAGPSAADSADAEVSALLARSGAAAFADALHDWCASRFDALQEPSRRGGEELFEQLDRYLRQNLSAQLSVADAAQQFHVSPSYISRVVKRYTGSTFVHHYMGLKIDEARRMLASGPEIKVKHVADALGFVDPHYFSKVFKEYEGSSPTEFKEKWG